MSVGARRAEAVTPAVDREVVEPNPVAPPRAEAPPVFYATTSRWPYHGPAPIPIVGPFMPRW